MSAISSARRPLLLSLFSGCGGLDLGFEQAGYSIGLAYDLRSPAIASYNSNRKMKSGHVADVTKLTISKLDNHFGEEFRPEGVIGGPPCQSFSRGNVRKSDDDPRRKMVSTFFALALDLHRKRGGLKFIVMENVPEVESADSGRLLGHEISKLERAGFFVSKSVLNARHYGVAQNRRRLFLVALHTDYYGSAWAPPPKSKSELNVEDVIGGLDDPVPFAKSCTVNVFPEHPNHWCMTPKSRKFLDRTLEPGQTAGRSFKTLSWNKPSYTVSYGHREVHVHPNCDRRLSVFEAMMLQGFPKSYVLQGTMSDQFSQVSEAVPPPLAKMIAKSIPTQPGKNRALKSSTTAA